LVRGYKIAMTPPLGPVVITLDVALQARELPKDFKSRIPKLAAPAPPVEPASADAQFARPLRPAQDRGLVVDRLRTAAAMPLLVELAETLQAAVSHQWGMRTNFPSKHPLAQGGAIGQADVILGLESVAFGGVVGQVARSSRAKKATTISISA